MKKILASLLLFVSMLSCGPSHAQAALPDAATGGISMSVPVGDKSSELMGILFGDAWYKLTRTEGAVSQTATGVKPGTVIGSMSLVFNAACLALSTWIMLFGAAEATMTSAHRGVKMAERYSTFWYPLRAAFTIAALAPVFGGYSLIQSFSMLAVKSSIAIANAIYGALLLFLGAGFPITPIHQQTGNDIGAALVQMHACRFATNIEWGPDGEVAANAENIVHNAVLNGSSTSPSDGIGRISFDGAEGTGMQTGACGRIHFSYLAETSATNTTAGLSKTVGSLFSQQDQQSLAAFRSADAGYGQSYWSALLTLDADASQIALSLVQGQAPAPDALAAAVQKFHSALGVAQAAHNAAVQEVLQGDGNGLSTLAQTQLKDAGWVYAGGFYWRMQQMNRQSSYAINATQALIEQVPNAANIRPSSKQSDVTIHGINNVQHYLREHSPRPLVESTTNSELVSEASKADDISLGALFDKIGLSSIQRQLGSYFSEAGNSGGDAITHMQTVGHYLMGASEAGVVSWIGVKAVAKGAAAGAEGETGWIPVVGGVVKGAGAAISSSLDSMSPIIMYTLLFSFLLGAYMAFWLPAIPFVMWVSGVTSWLISVLLSVVSAPIWAAAHITHEGDGWAGQQAKNGYMMILSLVLRPSLMLFGMIGGMLIMSAISYLLGALFPIAAASITADSVIGVPSMLILWLLLTTIVVATASRAFELSYEAADQILKWIGGGQEQLGDKGVHDSHKQLYVAAFRRVENRGAAAASGAGARSKQTDAARRGLDGAGIRKGGE